MSYSGGCSQFSGEKSFGSESMASVSGSGDGISDDFQQIPVAASSDPRVPIFNLSKLHQKMDLLQQFLSESIDQNTLLGKDQMDMVSTEISSAICQIFVNGAALISCAQSQTLVPHIGEGTTVPMSGNGFDEGDLKLPLNSLVDLEVADLIDSSDIRRSEIAGKAPMYSSFVAETVEPVGLTVQMSYPATTRSVDVRGCKPIKTDFNLSSEKLKSILKDPKDEEMKDEIDDEECELVELDAVELLAEHIHFCEICGKGFKRDANLRMHMRAHGNQFKTPEALAKPHKFIETRRKTRFSCPFVGCNRNKSHKKFRPLKSAICVKNHFRRSHCPKMFSCNRCNKKSFSVVADLKSHLKHCGESKWRCSCGTTFSRKDKLFGHMTLFEGHMPAITEEIERPKETTAMEEDEEETQFEEGESALNGGLDQGFFDDLQEGFVGIDEEDCLKDVFGSPSGLATGMVGWFDL